MIIDKFAPDIRGWGPPQKLSFAAVEYWQRSSKQTLFGRRKSGAPGEWSVSRPSTLVPL